MSIRFWNIFTNPFLSRGVNSPCTATHGTRQLGTSPKSRRSCQHLKYVWPLYYCHMDQALECEMVIYGGTWTTLSRVIVLKPLKAWQVYLRRQHGSPLRDPGGRPGGLLWTFRSKETKEGSSLVRPKLSTKQQICWRSPHPSRWLWSNLGNLHFFTFTVTLIARVLFNPGRLFLSIFHLDICQLG